MLNARSSRKKHGDLPSDDTPGQADAPGRRSSPATAPILKSVGLSLILSLGGACNDAERREVNGQNLPVNSNSTTPATSAPAPTAGTPLPSLTPGPASRTDSEMKVSVLDLTGAYVIDAAAADKLYKGRRVAVSGKVESVLLNGPPPVGSLKDLSGQTVMFFRGQTVVCVFTPEQKEAAAQLQRRQRVTVVGRVDGRYESRVLLRDCTVKSVEQSPPERRKGAKALSERLHLPTVP